MTSLQKNYSVPNKDLKFVPIKSLIYSSSGTAGLNHTLLVPFTYSNGVLDVSTTYPGFSPDDGKGTASGTSSRMVKTMGGNGPVSSLGGYFLVWFTAWLAAGGRNVVPDSGSIVLYNTANPCIMTKVQQSVQRNVAAVDDNDLLDSAFGLQYGLTEPPTSTEFVTGTYATNWDTAWVFKTPLILQYKVAGVVKYASFYTQFMNT